MVREDAANYAPSSSSKVSSHHDNFVRKLPYENYAIESPRDFPPPPPNSFRDKRDNIESMKNAESQPSQQLPPLPPTSQIQPSVTPDHQGEKSDLLSTFWDTFNNKQSMNNNASQPSKQPPPSQPSQQLLPLPPTSQIQPSVTPDHQGEKADTFSSLWDTFDNKESMNNNASQPSKQPPSQPSQQLPPLPTTSQMQPSVTPDHQGEKADIFSSLWDTFDNKESMNNNASQPSKQPPSQPSQLLPPLSPTSQIQPSVTPDHQGEKADIFSTLWDTFDNKELMNNNTSHPSKQPPSQPSQQLLPLSPTSQIQPSVTPDIFSSSQTQPSINNGTKTSTNISDPSASSSSAAGFLISSGTIPPLVETTKPSSLTRPLTAATAKTSSPVTLSTTCTSRPSQLPGDTANGTIPCIKSELVKYLK